MNKLVELIKENPNLPIYAWVNQDVVVSDEFANWLGEITEARKTRIICVEEKVYEYEDGKDELETYFAEEVDEFVDKSDDEIEEYVENLDWKDVILVLVNTPSL